MTEPDSDDERDERIRNEIIVDAYTPDEQAISWCYYLEDKLSVPFEAECVERHAISPLQEGELVTVTGMVDEVIQEMFVEIEWTGRQFGVPLAQLQPVDPDPQTKETIND